MKEKAEELYWMFDANSTYAINCVDEIIKACEYNQVESYNSEWWEGVKLEIENYE